MADETTPPAVKQDALNDSPAQYKARRAAYLDDKTNRPKKLKVNAGAGSALDDSPSEYDKHKKEYLKGQV